MKDPKEFFVAGVQHHDLHKVINDLEDGDELVLIPEPTNKFDPNAVRIEAASDSGALNHGVMIGYVPKKFSSEIAAALDVGAELVCVITHLDPKAKPWEQCKVVIKDLDTLEAVDLEEDEPQLDDEDF